MKNQPASQPASTAAKAAYTPGPWKPATYEGEKNRVVLSINNELIADCAAPSVEDYGIPEDYQANTRLVAAAPDLLAALEDVLAPGPQWQVDSAKARARAIIVKARG